MVCARCGTAFEGRFCPNCGTPATAPPSTTSAGTPSVQCSRCGTLYAGRFCPACGLPAWGPWIPPSAPGPSVGYSLLNVAWLFSLIVFLVILAISTVGMFGALVPITAGIGQIQQGETSDPGFESPGPWTFSPWTALGASGGVNATGGNPGGTGEIRLDGRPDSIVSGFWSQSFQASGSYPYLAAIRLDYRVFQVSNILGNLTIAVYVSTSAGTPPPIGSDGRPVGDVWSVTLAQPTNWTPARSVYGATGKVIDAIEVSSSLPRDGTYYLKVAALAWNRPGAPGTPTVVGIDNVRLSWRTAAFVDIAIVAPVPILLYYTQDPLAFYLWTAGVVAATVASLAVLAVRDRRTLYQAIRMGAERMPAKLRSRSATVAIMQTFMAVTFLSIVIGIVTQPPEPSFFTEIPEWYLIFSLLDAPVYEELIFRVLMIGVPMMLGSFVLRATGAARGRVPAGSTPGRYLLGSLRYLYGGGMSRRTAPAVLLPALLFLAASSLVFGLAHAPGYGVWKILPAGVAGLAMGYLFLRHGLHAAIIFHFATDVFIATAYLAGLDSALGVAMNLGFFLLIVPGSGFFAYYFLYAFRFFQDVLRPAETATASAPVAPGSGGAPYVPYVGYAPQGGPTGPRAGPPVPAIPSGYVPARRAPVYGTSPVEYRCPRCAWVEAAYENGRFRCLRCGYVA